MESHKGSDALNLKRKPTELDGLGACQASCLGSEHEPSLRSSSHVCQCKATRPSLADSCFNYRNSGVPRRIMFYSHGDWLDFPESVVHTLISGFKNGKSFITFSMADQPFIFDFLSMVVANLKTRKQRSVSWIDEADKCFFPTHFDQDEDDSIEWDLGVVGNRPQTPGMAFVSPPEVVKQVVTENVASSSQRRPTYVEILSTKLEMLEKGSESFLSVQKQFLSGMGPFASPDNILNIQRYVPKDINGQVRLRNFERQIQATEVQRGAANVQYGWFGSTKLDVARVLILGFANAGKFTEEGVLGAGVYLAPENRAFASVKNCDVDEKGIQCMILCRVILGNAEKIQPGLKQYFPSNENFDSGVDNLLSPKCYVVSSTHLDTHIHPEYLICFRLALNVRDYLFGLKDIRFQATATVLPDFSTLHRVRSDQEGGPVSPWIPFTVLFEEIQNSISPLAMELLLNHYQELKAKVISREEMVKKMRVIVGDQLLLSTLKRFKHSPALWNENSSAKKMKLDDPPNAALESNNSPMVKNDANGSSAPSPDAADGANLIT